MAKKLLIVEDNQDMRDSLKTFFSEDGDNVVAVASAEDAIDAVDEKPFDVAIIDINLPGKSGFQLVEYIRENGHKYPLIAMTARDTIVDKVKGFDIGFTDYVVKPFDLLELRARVNAHAKAGSPKDALKTKNFELRLSSMEFLAYGKNVELTSLEFRMMELLMSNSGALVKLDDLIEHAWGEQSDVVSPPVRIHIANLRKKIGDNSFQIIRTIPGIGYVFSDNGGENE
jgi:two-component system, OmpR family, response regulator PhoP